LPASLKEIRESYRGLVGAISYTQQVIFANTWLLSWLAHSLILKHPEAQMRSTTQFIPVLFNGSLEQAHAEVDVFLMPGESIAAVSDHIRKAVQDERVLFQAESDRAWEAPKPSLQFSGVSDHRTGCVRSVRWHSCCPGSAALAGRCPFLHVYLSKCFPLYPAAGSTRRRPGT
jgi:hypothetical protein